MFDSTEGLIEFVTGDIEEGKFKVTGFTEQPKLVYLFVDGQMFHKTIILENGAKYKAVFEGHNVDIESNSKEQQLLDQYIALYNSPKLIDLYENMGDMLDEEYAESFRAKEQELGKELSLETQALIKENPDAFASSLFVYLGVAEGFVKIEDAVEQYDLLGESAKENEFGRLLKVEVDAYRNTQIGAIAPDYSAPTPEGDMLSIHGLEGKVKLIDFWAAWCPPCRKESPVMRSIYEEFKDEGLVILGISLDKERDEWLEAIEEDGLGWNQISELKYWDCDAVKAYGVRGIPAMFLLDSENRVIAKNLRGEELREAIREALGK